MKRALSAAEQGLVFAHACVCNFHGGFAAVDCGRYEEGIAQLDTAVRLWRSIGGVIDVPHAYVAMAFAKAKLGDVQQGLALIEQALELIGATGHTFYRAETYRVKGELLDMSNQAEEADVALRTALEIARSSGASPDIS